METYRANGVEITQQNIPTKTMVELFELLDRLKNVANVSFNRVNFIRSSDGYDILILNSDEHMEFRYRYDGEITRIYSTEKLSTTAYTVMGEIQEFIDKLESDSE